MNTINLPCFGIRIEHDSSGGGSIVSDLHDNIEKENELYNAAIDGLESLILACACSGIDVESPAFLEAIETAINAIDNNT